MPLHDEVLSVGVDVDVKSALRQMSNFQRSMQRSMQQLTKGVEGVGKATTKMSKASVDDTDDLVDSVDKLTDAYSKEEKVLRILEQQMKDANGDQRDALKEQIDLVKKLMGEQKKASKTGPGAAFDPKLAAKSAKASAREFRDALKDTWGSFASKDLKGSLENATKGLGAGLKASFKGLAAGTGALGGGIGKLGGGLAKRGAARGGVAGGGMAAAGGALKAVGGLVSKMGPLLNMITKLGPLLGTISSVLLSVVKLFIDAEAQAKAFNKDILESASTAEYLGKAGGDTGLAFDSLKNTMDDIRESAYDLANLDWGITADQHKAVINVLTQEGVTLVRIEEEAKNAGKSVSQFAADLTHAGVAYSRAFGVPLQEINQLQAEMMTDLGMSAQETRLSFAQMTRAASESGIAANKFFSIIKGVSQDLSLYNTRMEDAVKMLKTLGKVMNPREAQKFMQTAMQGLKNMGRQERLRMTLLAGTGKMAGIVNRDIKKKQEGIAKTIAQSGVTSAEEASKILKSGNKAAIADLVNKLPDGVKGAVQEGIIDIDIQKTRAKKGTFGVSGAAANLGPAGALEAYRSALKGWGGGKSLKEGAGSIGMEMMADNLGISQDQLDQMIKFEAAMDMERQTLKNVFAKQAKGEKLTDDEQTRLQKAQGEGIKDSSDVDKAGYDQIFNSLDDATKKQHQDASKVEDMAQKQAGLTQSLLDKLSVLVDFIMNQLYNLFMDIWDLITGIPGVGMGAEEKAIKRQAFMSQDKAMQDAIKAATGPEGKLDVGRFKGEMVTKSLGPAIDKAFQHYAAARKTGGKEEIAATSAAVAAVTKPLDAAIKTFSGETGAYDPAATAEKVGKALTMANIDAEKQKAIKEKVAGGADVGEAIRSAGLDTGQIMDVYRKMAWAIDPAQTARYKGMIEEGSQFTGKQRAAGAKIDTMDAKLIAEGKLKGEAKASGFEQTKEGQDLLSDTAASTQTTAEATKDTATTLSSGSTAYFRFSNGFFKEYRRGMKEDFLDALRRALFEFYMYSAIEDREKVVSYMKKGNLSPAAFAEEIGKAAEAGKTAEKVTGAGEAGEGEEVPPNARGGLVTAVGGDGLARVRAAAGEGLASVAPGERITPAGAGGTTAFNISVNGVGGRDLANVIRAKVIEGVAEYKRRERFT